MQSLRRVWQALRGYAAAQDNRASSWAASGSSATAEVGVAAPTLARRARDAVRNDPYTARIVDLWTGNAVGAGISTRWPDKPHAAAWRRWADSTACDAEGRINLYTPKTNGKAERFTQISIGEGAHPTPFETSAAGTAAIHP